MADRRGLPFAGQEGRFFNLQNFKGINTKALRPAIDDEQFYWLENLMPIGAGNLRSTPSNGSTLFTASGGLTIVYMFFYNISTTNYVAVFFSDGTAVQVNTATTAQTTISSSIGTFYNGGALPQCAQWGNAGLLIVANVSNGYWAWDGAILYSSGSASPSWLNGGTPTTMPTGVQGTSIETYQSRVWICDNAVLHFSGPSNGASFSGGTGGGSFTSSDPFLRQSYNCVRQAGPFLYIFGDSSIYVVSNVQTSGSPLATTFNYQNVDPDIGTPWPNSVVQYGRGLVFAASTGVYSVYGGAAQKISDDLDGIFLKSASTIIGLSPTGAPSAGKASIYAIRCYCILLPMFDPITGLQRNIMAIWDGAKWFLASQDNSLTFIATQDVNSSLSVWATDQTHIFQCFQNASSTTLNKIAISKLWGGESWLVTKQALRSYLEAQDNSGSQYSITGTLDCVNEKTGIIQITQNFSGGNFNIIWIGLGGNVLQFTGSGGNALNFGSSGLTLSGQDAGSSIGALLGVTLQSTSKDFTIIGFAIVYRNQSPFGG